MKDPGPEDSNGGMDVHGNSWMDMEDSSSMKAESDESRACAQETSNGCNPVSQDIHPHDNEGKKQELMESLRLKSIGSPTESNYTQQQRRLRTRLPKGTDTENICPIYTPHSQSPIFNWNNPSLWKAMADHPLFPKYMEMQAELNELFEKIRQDCKKAACEKAFAALVRDLSHESPSILPDVAPLKHSLNSNGTVTKRRGRPPLKFKNACPKKRGKPRFYSVDTDKTFEPLKHKTSYRGNEHFNLSPSKGSYIRATRRSYESSLTEYRRPERRCKECGKLFSGAKWFEKHIAVCNRLTERGQDQAKPDGRKEEVICETSKDQLEDPVNNIESAMSSDSFKVCLSPSKAVGTIGKIDGNEGKTPPRIPLFPLSPAGQKSPGGARSRSASPQKKRDCFSDKLAPLSLECDGCGRCFTYRASLEKHKRTCVQKFLDRSYSSLRSEEMPHLSPVEKKQNSHSQSSSALTITSPKGFIHPERLCKSCGKAFIKNGALDRHQKVCHLNRKSSNFSHCCVKCSILFLTKTRLMKHQAFCCPELCEQSQKFINHLKCKKCSRRFPNFKKQLKHRALCCPDRETDSKVCHKCFKVFLMEDRMTLHQSHCA